MTLQRGTNHCLVKGLAEANAEAKEEAKVDAITRTTVALKQDARVEKEAEATKESEVAALERTIARVENLRAGALSTTHIVHGSALFCVGFLTGVDRFRRAPGVPCRGGGRRPP